jgi:hypothetical protein
MVALTSDSQTNTQVLYCAHERDAFQSVQTNQESLVNAVKIVKEDQGDSVLRNGEDKDVLLAHQAENDPKGYNEIQREEVLNAKLLSRILKSKHIDNKLSYRPIPVIINGSTTHSNGVTVGNELSISKAAKPDGQEIKIISNDQKEVIQNSKV